MTTGQAERSATGRGPARRTQPAKSVPAKRPTTPARPAARAAARRAPARPAQPGAAEARTAQPGATQSGTVRPRTAKPGAARSGTARSSTAQSGAGRKESARPAQRAQRAVAEAISRQSGRIVLPYGIGPIRVPSPDRLAFYGGVATLALLGIVEWPVALVIGAGHLLADDHHHKLLADFGEALGEA
jgi:hypothetical protein